MKTVIALLFLVGAVSCQPFNLISNIGNITKVQSLVKNLGDQIKDLIESIKKVVQNNSSSIGSDIKNLISSAKSLAENAIKDGGSPNEVISKLKSFVTKFTTEIEPQLKTILQQLKKIVEDNVGNITSTVKQVVVLVNKIFGAGEVKANLIGSVASKAVENAGDNVDNALSFLTGKKKD